MYLSLGNNLQTALVLAPKPVRIESSKSKDSINNALDEQVAEMYLPSYSLPKTLAGYECYQLPFSLMTPKFRNLMDFEINEWG